MAQSRTPPAVYGEEDGCRSEVALGEIENVLGCRSECEATKEGQSETGGIPRRGLLGIRSEARAGMPHRADAFHCERDVKRWIRDAPPTTRAAKSQVPSRVAEAMGMRRAYLCRTRLVGNACLWLKTIPRSDRRGDRPRATLAAFIRSRTS